MNKMKILLVEDNVSFAVDIEMTLEDLGYGVMQIADNAKDALDIVKSKSPDLIIADISLKGNINGIEMIEAIPNKNIGVIFITQYRDEEFYKKAQSLRPVAYLVKPFDKLTLQSCIETAFAILSTEEESDSFKKSSGFNIEDSIFIKENKVLNKVDVVDIQSVQSDGNYCDIRLISGKRYAIKISLANILQKLPDDHFIRIHQRYVVQNKLIDKIDTVDNQILIGEQSFPIGRTYRDQIMKQLKRL